MAVQTQRESVMMQVDRMEKVPRWRDSGPQVAALTVELLPKILSIFAYGTLRLRDHGDMMRGGSWVLLELA